MSDFGQCISSYPKDMSSLSYTMSGHNFTQGTSARVRRNFAVGGMISMLLLGAFSSLASHVWSLMDDFRVSQA